MVLNRYSIFIEDIEPCGFRFAVMNGFVSGRVVSEVQRQLDDEAYRNEVVDHNYQIAGRYFSYAVLRRSLGNILTGLTGWAPETDRRTD